MNILVSAAETSSDIHAEVILRAMLQLLKRRGVKVRIAGIGGIRLRSIEGFEAIENAESLRSMGFSEVIQKLGHIRRVRSRLLQFSEEFQPDIVITFDYPEFHLSLMKGIRKRFEKLGIPLPLRVCAIPPKVWVWRSHRIQKIRDLYDGVVVVFPFEKALYENAGIPVIFAGNPLIANLPFDLPREEAQAQLGLTALVESGWEPYAVFLGSREAEIRHHSMLMLRTIEEMDRNPNRLHKKILLLIPVPPGVPLSLIEAQWLGNFPPSESMCFRFFEGQSELCLRASRWGWIKSGTSTLEAVILGNRPVIFYRASKVSEWIFRVLVRYLGPVGLPNILLGIRNRSEAIFPEFLGPEATPKNLITGITGLQKQTEEKLDQKLEEARSSLFEQLAPGPDVGGGIAHRILDWFDSPISQKKGARSLGHPPARVWVRCASECWSAINWTVRRLMRPFSKTLDILPNTVLIGNLQAGGTGKTPLLIAFAAQAVLQGKFVIILSRGYGGRKSSDRPHLVLPNDPAIDPKDWGDEVAEIQEAIPSALMVIGSNRLASAKSASEWVIQNRKSEMATVTFLDDGFQNASIQCQYTILCMTDRGRSEVVYRDFLSESKFATLLLWTKGSRPQPWLKGTHRIQWIWDSLPTLPVELICALGDPLALESDLQDAGVRVKVVHRYPDHHSWSIADLSDLQKKIETACNRGHLIGVTPKDWVKLRRLGIQAYEFPPFEIEMPRPDRVAVLRRTADVKGLFKVWTNR